MPRTPKLHQRNTAPWFRSRHLDYLLEQVGSGAKTIADTGILRDLGPDRGDGATRVGIRTRCGLVLPVERLAYNIDELSCERCADLTMGGGDEYVRPAPGEVAQRLHRT